MKIRGFDRHEDHIRVPWYRKLAYGSGNFSIGASEVLLSNFLMVFYTVILQMDAKVVGLALFLPRLWDAFSDPLMGQISDHTRSRWGRRRPYIFFGAVAFALTNFLMFTPPASFSPNAIYYYLFVLAFLYYSAYTVVFVPYLALGAELSIDYHERTRVQIWRSVFMFAPSLVVPWTWKLTQLEVFGNERSGTFWVMGAYGILLVVPLWLCFFFTSEEGELQERAGLPLSSALRMTFKNVPFLLAAISYALFMFGATIGLSLGIFLSIYHVFGGVANDRAASVQAYSGMIGAVTTIGGALLWGYLGTKIGKRRGFLAGLFVMAVAAPCSWFLFDPDYPYLQLLFPFLFGLGLGAMGVFPNSMIADVCDLDELESGSRREGAFNGVLSFMGKAGFSGTLLATGIVLDWAGFDETATIQTVEAVFNLRLYTVFVPLLTMGSVIALVWFYPLTEGQLREVRTVLEARRAARQQSQALPRQGAS